MMIVESVVGPGVDIVVGGVSVVADIVIVSGGMLVNKNSNFSGLRARMPPLCKPAVDEVLSDSGFEVIVG